MDLPEIDPGSDPRAQLARDRRRFRRAALISAAFVALLWWIHLAQHMFDAPLRALTLRPGDPWGLIGVLTAPLLHGSFEHLVSNSLPLLILGTLAIATLPRATPRALVFIWLLAGLGTWLIGRPSAHLGASGVTHGLMLLVFVAGVLRRDRPAIAAALIAFFLYGGMLLTVFPREEGVSWEYHLTGAAAGLLAALIWFRLDPPPPRKRYSWEDEPDPQPVNDELEPPPPEDVPVLWHRVEPRDDDRRGVVLQFPPRNDPPQ
ncbi:rhomboid family intramembrane serine protease [Pseudomarimonas salicorniae]|uniref:Rhomboid family intramembrane serine protease n=1 Tax=Pseudomarimonas salicorniae TaxID=2933270 RepID=A0ABT0GG60_9GAMM|nr:rhomboid family intramembrane serine protease [Lysobacter sp. CAU 1642]MCK7593529.1 rhomboid family intramembrane serine protease [Lysobacter sp. CAU 1642]